MRKYFATKTNKTMPKKIELNYEDQFSNTGILVDDQIKYLKDLLNVKRTW